LKADSGCLRRVSSRPGRVKQPKPRLKLKNSCPGFWKGNYLRLRRLILVACGGYPAGRGCLPLNRRQPRPVFILHNFYTTLYLVYIFLSYHELITNKKWRKIKMRKTIITLLLLAFAVSALAGCQSGGSVPENSSFDATKAISVISREDGSGTRGAFIELFGIEVKGDDGSKKDMTTKEAVIAKQTDIMMANIAQDKYAIGYISLGSLGDTVKALRINGTEASAENVKNGRYPIVRPFNIATKGEPAGLAKDFIDFILSAEGQAVVSKNYIAITDDAPAYAGNKPLGKIVVAGSSSVTPVLEKLKEAYLTINANAAIEIQQSDSSAGMTGTIDGTCDIGMASRELKDSELTELTATQIAMDGIAVIVNNDNPVAFITAEQVRSIFTGETTKWSDVNE